MSGGETKDEKEGYKKFKKEILGVICIFLILIPSMNLCFYNYIKIYVHTLNLCILLYVNYTSIKHLSH